MNLVENHPQRLEIIEAMISGESLRSIGARVSPPVNHSTLARFKRDQVLTGIATMQVRSPKSKDIRRLAEQLLDPNKAQEEVVAAVRQEIETLLQARHKAREKYLQNAENIDETGQMNHSALAAHDRVLLQSLELRAKLHGLLQSEQPNAAQIAVCVQVQTPGQLPTPHAHAHVSERSERTTIGRSSEASLLPPSAIIDIDPAG